MWCRLDRAIVKAIRTSLLTVVQRKGAPREWLVTETRGVIGGAVAELMSSQFGIPFKTTIGTDVLKPGEELITWVAQCLWVSARGSCKGGLFGGDDTPVPVPKPQRLHSVMDSALGHLSQDAVRRVHQQLGQDILDRALSQGASQVVINIGNGLRLRDPRCSFCSRHELHTCGQAGRKRDTGPDGGPGCQRNMHLRGVPWPNPTAGQPALPRAPAAAPPRPVWVEGWGWAIPPCTEPASTWASLPANDPYRSQASQPAPGGVGQVDGPGAGRGGGGSTTA